ncbi:dihydroorotase [Romeria aff. gracilis LEGE 07310]|uniref:Dihydroorotase n=1 Tax=Vasconcelosia minhoensis LEGE 07310 TaxID=915328 RepID=A0A8J7AJG3_9CYAN|nr:dihydroorotase [Romeria gracilis]MBE9080084.1 dihydroorotase [Romeria aff. gracilis LEGE 07310]
MPSTLIRQVRLLDPLSQRDCVTDVLIEADWVSAIAPSLSDYPADTDIIEGAGLILAPGLVDLYSQSGEPGYESRETLASLQQAAAAGGFTRVGLLPNTRPVTDNSAAVAQQLRLSQGIRRSQLLPWAAITLGTQGQQLSELAELATAGTVGFSDGQPIENAVLLSRLLDYAQPLQKPIALWPCDRALANGGAARAGVDALRLGLPMVPAIAETTAVATILECVAVTQTPVHLMRISTVRSVALIREAKARGLPISASVTWLHLVCNSQDLQSYDPSLRLAPPLGTPLDQQALIEGLADGTLDAIAVDHQPYTYEEKTVPFSLAPPGAVGLELALPVLWQRFVASGQWSALQLWRYLSLQPACCLALEPPQVQVHQPTELVLFDPAAAWTVSPTALKSLSTNTAWLNRDLTGRVLRTWLPA